MTCCGEIVRSTGFKPDFNVKALSEKFYARHEKLLPDPNYAESYKRYSEEIDKRQNLTPHTMNLAPRTENQVYGWLQHLAFEYEPGYERMIFHRARRTDEDIKIQNQINLAVLRGLKR
uniref:Uncharacterized protein n=1 Tax=Ceratitis capitata TaxID=7213 RepID=W8AFZ3_CERCA